MLFCPKQTTFLNDRAPCMSALATQHILKANKIDLFGNSQRPGSSTDINACEILGSILKSRLESRLEISNEDLSRALTRSLGDLEFDTVFFASLLESYPSQFNAIQKAGGAHANY